MADLTIGEIIALAYDRAAIWEPGWVVEQWQCPCGYAPVFCGLPHEPRRCPECKRPKPKPSTIGALRVTAVDRERRTITVSA